MTACLDTGVFLQIFGRKQPFYPILRALLDGRLILAVSTEILLEYQEVTTRLSGAERWRDMAALLDLLAQLHGNIRHVEPKFRFNLISTDPDDNKFCDCAIAAEANFVVTEDNDFNALKSAGYKPKPISPEEFIRQYLQA
jgi:putative PIN family toxin of toxin-antitoxin system